MLKQKITKFLNKHPKLKSIISKNIFFWVAFIVLLIGTIIGLTGSYIQEKVYEIKYNKGLIKVDTIKIVDSIKVVQDSTIIL